MSAMPRIRKQVNQHIRENFSIVNDENVSEVTDYGGLKGCKNGLTSYKWKYFIQIELGHSRVATPTH
jgi:hypothetical protein